MIAVILLKFLQTGLEKCLAESFQDISRHTHEDCGISTHYVSYFPRRIYIEAPGIVEIKQIMKFSAYSHLLSRATRILDDGIRTFLHSSNIPDLPCPWVRIIQRGIYRGDLAVVLFTPKEGASDVVTIAVVPRFTDSKNKKRGGGDRPAPALLDPKFVAKFPSTKNNLHFIQSRMFHPNGLEFLDAPFTHALKIEPRPSEAELILFQSSFAQADKTYEADLLIQRAVNSAFRNESRRLWRTGDRVRILRGSFIGTLCSIHEVDELNHSIVVGLPDLTYADVEMEDLERHFLVGDQVRVAFGISKGRTGSIINIIDHIGTIVERTANQVFEVSFPSIFFSFVHYYTQFDALLLYLESHTIVHSFANNSHPAASSSSGPKPPHKSEAVKSHQMLGGVDPRIGKEAALYVGQMKGYQGRLIDINRNFGKIECPGRQPPTFSAPLKHFVLMCVP